MSTAPHSQSVATPKPHALERQRIASLRRLNILDTAAEPRFDRITRLVAKTLKVETVLVSLVDERRQWFKSVCNLGVSETDRDVAFCAHAINEPSDRLVIPDATQDPRFAKNPLVIGAPLIRSYAGIVLRSNDGLPLGTLCTIGYEPREFSDEYLDQLADFAEIVNYELYRSSWGLDQSPVGPVSEYIEGQVPANGELASVSALSFDAVMALRDHRDVVAVTLKLPRIEGLARAYGNHIVQELSDEVQRRLRLAASDVPYHLESSSLGGLCLFVAMDRSSDSDTLSRLRDSLVKNLGRRIQTKQVTIATPIRIGISQPAREDCNTDDLLRCSQIAFEHINSARVGPVCKYYNASMGELAGRYQMISASVPRALSSNQFSLHYQPKVNVNGNTLAGVEALIRWQDTVLDYVSPPELLQVLEDLDMTPDFDFWVIGQVCDQIRRWSAEGKDGVKVAINICGTTLLQPGFPEKARKLVAQRNVRADLIELEILESAVVDDLQHAVEQLRLCRELGFSVGLDDFGAGQTSLSYLNTLPIDTVKIDKSFVDHIVTDAAASNLIFQVISMCKNLGKTTVVEGVETVGQYLLLRSFGCDQIQGYYFSRPITPHELSERFREEKLVFEPLGLHGL